MLINVTTRFHWVRCQLDAVTKCQNLRGVKRVLEALPKDINETYERILLRIIGRGEEIAKTAEKILMWLVGAMRPLRLMELEETILIELGSMELNTSSRLIDPSDILTICGSFVEEFEDWGVSRVRLSHYTVRVSMKNSN